MNERDPIAHVFKQGNKTRLVAWKDGVHALPQGDHILYIGMPEGSLTAADLAAIATLFDACNGNLYCGPGSHLDIAFDRVERLLNMHPAKKGGQR